MAYQDALQALLQRYGQSAPANVTGTPAATYGTPAATYGTPAASYGTQANPLDAFYGAGGSTGNKTTNKDLPQWLRDLGMKGDAYAGGMLKPQIRYGFWYKNGKINFADGTSYAAKKQKDGTYSYTGSDGKAAVYDPTDEQDAYNKKYQNATANQSFVSKLGATAGITHSHVRNILDGAYDALRGKGSIFGGTPLGTKLSNAVTGRHDKPIADQYGGPTPKESADYVAAHGANSLGYQPQLHQVGSAIASYYAGNYGIGQLSHLSSAVTGAGSTAAGTAGTVGGAATDATLPEIVVTGTRSGLGAADLGGLGASAASLDAGGGLNGPKNYGDAGGLNTNSGTGIFSNNGTNGLNGVGLSDAQRVAAGGAIRGGSGLGSAVNSGVSSGMGTNANSNWTDWIGPLINAGTAIYGNNQANNANTSATNAAIAAQQHQFDQVRADTAPQRALGAASIGTLADLSGYNESGTPNYSAFHADPGYQFSLQQGQQAIDRSAAARGGLLSGAAVKAGTRYAQGTADQGYSAFYDRLLEQAGLGSTGIGASAAAGQNAANNIGNAQLNLGNSRASGYLNTAANVNNAAQAGWGNYLLRKYTGEN